MKKNNSVGIILGLLFLVIGGGYLAEVFGAVENFTIFFDGWWTMFIIVPCFCGLFRKDDSKKGYLIGIGIGLILLLMAQDVLSGEKVWALLLAGACVLIGVNLLFPKKQGRQSAPTNTVIIEERFEQRTEKSASTVNGSAVEYVADAVVVEDADAGQTKDTSYTSEEASKEESSGEADKVVCSAVFSGRDIRVDHSEFGGADLSAVFGGIDLNLKNAIIRKNVTINVKAVFGGIDILMPADVRVVVDVTPILGGVDNCTRTPLGADENTPTVFVHGTCLFGGLDIK